MRSIFPGTTSPRIPGILALSLLVASGCAYYNTFYLAKKHYREGNKEQERSLMDTPAPGASAKYELVIRQCTKVLTEYPKSKWVDDASYLLGAALYGKGDYVAAIKRLAEFPARFPESPYVADARFVEGLARYRRKEYAQADSIFREVDIQYPKFTRRWELYYYAGETESGRDRYPAAVYWYGRALGAAKARRERANALRRSGDAYFAAGRPDTAEVIYAQCLKVEERSKEQLDVALKRGEALRDLRRYAVALDFLEDWKVFAAAEHREGELMLHVYECMGLVGRVQEAIEGYRELVEKFPRTSVAYEAQFRIGYLYESSLQDLDSAGREYERLKGQPQSEFVTQAARRGQNLATLRQYRAALATDTTQARAKAAFLLAELYYFQLEKRDSAVAQYRLVEDQFPRSVFAPKSAYARLWITAYDRDDTLGAMALTDTIASRYHGTRYAESALYLWKRWSGRVDERTALFDSLLARPDTSRAASFEPEPELRLPPLPVDSAAVAAQFAMSAAESARIDSLRKLARELKEGAQKKGGKQPTPPSAQGSPTPTPPPDAEKREPEELPDSLDTFAPPGPDDTGEPTEP